MMMAMAPDPRIRPIERRQVRESRRTRGAVHHGLAILVPGKPWHLAPGQAIGEIDDGFLAFAPDRDIAAKLGERCTGRRRTMRTNGDSEATRPAELIQKGARHAKLGLGAAPEQTGG